MRGYLIVVICLVLILLFSGFLSLFNKNTIPEINTLSENITTTKMFIDETVLVELKSQLQIALGSGGITPEMYQIIQTKISSFESQGYDPNKIDELKIMLSKLNVGGQGSEKSNTSIGSNTSVVDDSSTQQPVLNSISQEATTLVKWDYDQKENRWSATGIPPDCPELIFESPLDVKKATAILYPGQLRGKTINDYKAHGGFRYDDSSVKSLKVIVPFDGYVWRGTRYLVKGEVQYGFDIVHECGIMHRLGHLTNLSPEFQKLADTMPEPKEGDSRTVELSPFIFVKKGDFLATQVKTDTNNIGLDWGVYDLRYENEASKNVNYRGDHWFQRWYDFHGFCWLDYISLADQSIVKSLPGGDGISGKSSDYCN